MPFQADQDLRELVRQSGKFQFFIIYFHFFSSNFIQFKLEDIALWSSVSCVCKVSLF